MTVSMQRCGRSSSCRSTCSTPSADVQHESPFQLLSSHHNMQALLLNTALLLPSERRSLSCKLSVATES